MSVSNSADASRLSKSDIDKNTNEENKPPHRTRFADLESRESIDSLESYHPFKERRLSKPTSDFGALAHLLKTSLGSGILAMPMAFKNGGLILGAVGTIFLGVICTHCIYMLVMSSQTLSKRLRVPHLTFPETGEAAFETGPKPLRKFASVVKWVITTELLLSFILGNTVYVVFISQSMCQVIDSYFKIIFNVRLFVLILWLPLFLMCTIRRLRDLVPFSILANIFVLISFLITSYYVFREIKDPGKVEMIASITKIPLFLTTVLFALEGVGTVLPIENEMKNPQHFLGGKCGIIYISMSIVVCLYGIIGFFGYLEYGENTKGSVTLNLPLNEIPAQIVKILIPSAIFFTYALQYYVPISMVWNMIKGKVPDHRKKVAELSVRAGLVSLTIIFALVIPNLEPIIGLVGAISFSMLGVLIPSIIDTMTRWPNMGAMKWRLIKNIFILIVALVALVAGTYASIEDAIETYFK